MLRPDVSHQNTPNNSHFVRWSCCAEIHAHTSRETINKIVVLDECVFHETRGNTSDVQFCSWNHAETDPPHIGFYLTFGDLLSIRNTCWKQVKKTTQHKRKWENNILCQSTNVLRLEPKFAARISTEISNLAHRIYLLMYNVFDVNVLSVSADQFCVCSSCTVRS